MKEINFDVTGGEKQIEYTVNCADAVVNAITSASWLQVSVDSTMFTITASENTSGDRRAYIIPTLNGEYCDTTANKLSVFQKGVSTGCSVTLVITGLENKDKATIDWGDETTSENKRNGTYRHRYTSGDEHTVTVTAEGYDTATGTFICGNVTALTINMDGGGTEDVKISFTGLPNDLRTGGLQVTGSTYTAQFSLIYKTGALSGTLTADQRDAMTFSGQFTLEGSGGGSIYNECGSEQGEIYAVTSATWDVSTNTLNVGMSKCISTCSVIFHVTNNTSSDVNGSVEIFYGQGTSRSFHFDVDGLSPGSSKNITKALTSDQCGQEINTAQFESPSLNTPMNVHGSRMLNDGTTVNLEIPNSF
jgi:hypothetical protein